MLLHDALEEHIGRRQLTAKLELRDRCEEANADGYWGVGKVALQKERAKR